MHAYMHAHAHAHIHNEVIIPAVHKCVCVGLLLISAHNYVLSLNVENRALKKSLLLLLILCAHALSLTKCLNDRHHHGITPTSEHM